MRLGMGVAWWRQGCSTKRCRDSEQLCKNTGQPRNAFATHRLPMLCKLWWGHPNHLRSARLEWNKCGLKPHSLDSKFCAVHLRVCPYCSQSGDCTGLSTCAAVTALITVGKYQKRCCAKPPGTLGM